MHFLKKTFSRFYYFIENSFLMEHKVSSAIKIRAERKLTSMK